MTYASDKGLEIGDKIKYLGKGDLETGSILTFTYDDDTSIPKFTDSKGRTQWFSLKREWEKVSINKPICSVPNKMTEKYFPFVGTEGCKDTPHPVTGDLSPDDINIFELTLTTKSKKT